MALSVVQQREGPVKTEASKAVEARSKQRWCANSKKMGETEAVRKQPLTFLSLYQYS